MTEIGLLRGRLLLRKVKAMKPNPTTVMTQVEASGVVTGSGGGEKMGARVGSCASGGRGSGEMDSSGGVRLLLSGGGSGAGAAIGGVSSATSCRGSGAGASSNVSSGSVATLEQDAKTSHGPITFKVSCGRD